MSDRAQSNDQSFSLSQALLSAENFTHFNLGLSEQEFADLQAVIIKHQSVYDNFGDMENLNAGAADFLVAAGTNRATARQAANIIDRIIRNSISVLGCEAAWVSLRASTPNSLFDVPRWHTDGYFFEQAPYRERKVAVALKGSKTLFSNLPLQYRQAFLECAKHHRHDQFGLQGRHELAELIGGFRGIEAMADGQGTIFTVGDQLSAAIHSEPPVSSERLFLSIVPGTENQVQELDQTWKAYAAARPPQPQPQSPSCGACRKCSPKLGNGS